MGVLPETISKTVEPDQVASGLRLGMLGFVGPLNIWAVQLRRRVNFSGRL